MAIIWILFSLSVSSCLLQNLKEASVLSRTTVGPQMIPFLRIWGVLPATLLSTVLVARLEQRMGIQRMFILVTSTLLALIAGYVCVLHPYEERLECVDLARRLELILPAGAQGGIALIRHWPISFFYVLCELWPIIVVALGFWGTLNLHIPSERAKSLYGVIKVGATLSALATGPLSIFFSRLDEIILVPGVHAWHRSLLVHCVGITLLAVSGLYLYHKMFSQVVKIQTPVIKPLKRDKASSLATQFRYLLTHPAVAGLGIVEICYLLVHDLTDLSG